MQARELPRDAKDLRDRLIRFLLQFHGAQRVRIEALRVMTGGASRQTWSFDAIVENSSGATRTIPLVLRSDMKRGTNFMDRNVEYDLLKAAGAAGVPVPAVHAMGDDCLGAPFFMMERVEGETIPRRILRDDPYSTARRSITKELGTILAKIHSVPTPHPEFSALPAPSANRSPAEQELSRFEEIYRSITPDPHPVFELAFRWLREHRPSSDRQSPRLVHGDFRLGNLIVGPDGVRAVLDWELAHLGDPIEDLGWLCVRSWRFGNDDKPVAGIGQRQELWDAYEAAGGQPIDPKRARFWEMFGNLRWGIMCIIQTRPVLDRQSSSVELASIGRRVAETEWELLDLMEET